MSNLRGVKVGDKVWIVPNGATENECYYSTVQKVGRKWVRVTWHKLDLSTGRSDYLECRPVIAYRSREEWLERKLTRERWHKLGLRFQRIGTAAEPLKPEFVVALQAVVDQYYPQEPRK